MVEGNRTNANGDQLLVSVKEPYLNLIEISGYEYVAKGESDTLYYTKEFRWSTDGILYNDWKPLNTENLKNVLVNPEKPFYPQYRLTQNGDGELTFESIALETVTEDGLVTNIPLCGIDDNSNCCGRQNLVFECCGGGFNPYAVGNSSYVYTQLSQVVSNMFGFCVQYFKTSADQRSKDVILHEYSLLNVIAEGNVKIVVPDNQLPTREINFNPLMMDYPVVFEVHIVKQGFRSAFGQDAKPEVGDYLYFEQYVNKMYEVNAVSETDDYLYTGAYWRVSLAQYQKRSAVKFETPEIELDTDTLIFNTDKFNVEVEKQEEDVRKPEQYNTIGKVENDYVRRILDKRLKIVTESIYNNWTIISKQHYALKSIPSGMTAIQYRYDKGWGESDERMLTMWVRPKYTNPHFIDSANKTYADSQYQATTITEILNEGGYAAFKVESAKNIKKGMLVRVMGTNYPKVLKVLSVVYEANLVIVNHRYIDGCLGNKAYMLPTATNTFLVTESGFALSYDFKSVCVSLGGKDIVFDLKKNGVDGFGGLAADRWWAFVVMVKPSEKKCALFVYSLSAGNPNLRTMDSAISQVYYSMQECHGDLTLGDGHWGLVSCDMDITNIRVWNELCEESKHNLILSQYVIRDSHKCELVDNAQPELMLDKVTNPR